MPLLRRAAKYDFRESVLVTAADIILILGLFCTFAAIISPTIINGVDEAGHAVSSVDIRHNCGYRAVFVFDDNVGFCSAPSPTFRVVSAQPNAPTPTDRPLLRQLH